MAFQGFGGGGYSCFRLTFLDAKFNFFVIVTSVLMEGLCSCASVRCVSSPHRNCDSQSGISIATYALREFLVNIRLSKSKQGEIL